MSKLSTCELCNSEYDKSSRIGKPGRIAVCDECAEEAGDVQKYTGNVVYSHKTGASLQINSDPRLTKYIINATKLKNKGSNLGQNLCASGHLSNKMSGACVVTPDVVNYKQK